MATRGYVYVFSNPAMPNLLKIGKTKNDPEQRAKALSSKTGVPQPFKVEYKIQTDDMDWLECETHRKLAKYRENRSREFFKVDLATAIKTINQLESSAKRWKPILQPTGQPTPSLPLSCGSGCLLLVLSICAIGIVGSFISSLSPTISSTTHKERPRPKIAQPDTKEPAIERDYSYSKYSVLSWNVPSSESTSAAAHLPSLGKYDVVALFGIDNFEDYEKSFNKAWPGHFGFIRSGDEETGRQLLIYSRIRFHLWESSNAREVEGLESINYGLFARIRDKSIAKDLYFVLIPAAQAEASFSQHQASGLSEWAREKSEPLVAISDYSIGNFDTPSEDTVIEVLKDKVWKLMQPNQVGETTKSGDGKVDEQNSASSSTANFVAGAAKDWTAECRVIIPKGDFQNTDKASGQWPVELILKNNKHSR